mgnify:FL=1
MTQPQNPESFYALGEEAMYAHRARRAKHGNPQELQSLLLQAIQNYEKVVVGCSV